MIYMDTCIQCRTFQLSNLQDRGSLHLHSIIWISRQDEDKYKCDVIAKIPGVWVLQIKS